MRILAYCLFLLSFAPTTLAGGPLGTSTTLTVRDIKPSPGRQKFQVGVVVQGAPIRALAKQMISKAKEQYPEVAEVVDLLREVDPAPLGSMNMDQIKQELLALPGLSDEQKQQIQSLPIDNSTKDQILAVVDVLQDKEESIAFSLRPFLRMNFSGLRLTLEAPVAGFYLADQTTFALGNVNMDVSFSHTGDIGAGGVGVGYGVHIYAPTGTERANTLAFPNLLQAPAFLHEYLTPAIYLSAGMDLPMLKLRGHAELLPMFAMRGAPRYDLIMAGRYGVSVCLDLAFIEILAEASGMVDVKNAEGLEVMYLTAGLGFDMGAFQVHAAFQSRLLGADALSTGTIPSLDLGSPSDYNVFLRLGFGT
jgi:hypothetical protein